MADTRQLRRLIAYNQWGDEKILAAIEGLSGEALAHPVEAYVGSVANNLRHTLFAQLNWLARWKGEPSPVRPDQPVIAPWREAYAAAHAALAAYVGSLSEADAERTVKWTDFKGNAREHRLDQLITHLVNHGTQHRAETGLLLERIGRSPGDLDYLYFSLEHA